MPLDFGNAHDEPSLVIVDYLLNDVYSKQVCGIFTRGSRYGNISFNLNIRISFIRTSSEDIPLDAHYRMALENVRDIKEFMYLANQMFPEENIGRITLNLDATQEPHGYLIWDLKQDKNDSLRFRTKIYPTFKYPTPSALI